MLSLSQGLAIVNFADLEDSGWGNNHSGEVEFVNEEINMSGTCLKDRIPRSRA